MAIPVVGSDGEVVVDVVVVVVFVVVGVDGEVVSVHCSKAGASMGPPTAWHSASSVR